MKKKNEFVLLALILALAGCNNENTNNTTNTASSSVDDSSPTQSISDSESSSSQEEYEGEISLNNGFENDDAINVFDAVTGIKKSINEDSSKVLTGNKSFKMNVSEFADASFKFNDNVSPLNITEYEFLSFWIYIDHDGTFGLTNSCLKNATTKQYINDSIQGKEWTKITIDKNSETFKIIKYNVGFNNFIISGTGSNYGKVLNYDFYIDDVRTYKTGMAGECNMVFKLDDGTYTSKLDTVAAGKEITIPEVTVYSPLGYSIYGANANVNKKIVGEDGNEVSISNNKFTINKIGTYSLIATYVYDGINNVFSSKFDVVLGNVDDTRMGVAYSNESYTIPEIELKDLDTNEKLDAIVTKKVLDASNHEVSIEDNKFTPTSTGVYKVNYEFSKNVNGTENKKVVTKDLFVNDVHGIVTDFSSNDSDIFNVNTLSVAGSLANNEEYKINKNENTGSYKLVVANEGGVSLSFNENFPYETMDGFNYLSFWVYSESIVPLTLETSISTKKTTLNPQTWTLVKLLSSEIVGKISDTEIVIYDEITKAKINCNFYIDDVRLVKDGNPQEVLFANNVTTEDYNKETSTGRLFSANYKYEVDLSLYDLNGNKLTDKATITSITDKRNRNVNVEEGKYFTPITVGKHTILLSYEKDGIVSTSKKIIDVTEQMLLSPFDKFGLIPGEQNKEYSFNNLPELWNYGVIDNQTNIEILVYDEKGEDVEVVNNKFTPKSYGKYSVFFMAQDDAIKSSSALLEASLLVYQQDKYGVVCDFENKDFSYMESTTYYYGEVSDFFLGEDKAHSGNYSGVFYNLSDETKEMKFSLRDNNPVGDISNTKYVSFYIYIDDPNNNSYKIAKTAYAGWINETDSSYHVGTLNQRIESNKWIEVRIERKDYEEVLGGTIFAGQTVSAGGSNWAAANNDFITTFAVMLPDYGQISKDVKIYIDDFTLGY